MRALELNDRLAESYVALGRLRLREWDWPAAEQALTHALALDPNLADAHHEYANYLRITGRIQQAVEKARRARELDPLTLLRTAFVGWMLHADRQRDAAIEEFRYATELNPGFGEAWRGLAAPLLAKGMYGAVVEAMQTSLAVGGANVARGPQPSVAYAYARAGKGTRCARAIQGTSRPDGAGVSGVRSGNYPRRPGGKRPGFCMVGPCR